MHMTAEQRREMPYAAHGNLVLLKQQLIAEELGG